MKIVVTPADLRGARRGSQCECLIARALKRTLPGLWEVRPRSLHDMDDPVWLATLHGPNGPRVFELPAEAGRMAEEFDRSGQAYGFEFELPYSDQ